MEQPIPEGCWLLSWFRVAPVLWRIVELTATSHDIVPRCLQSRKGKQKILSVSLLGICLHQDHTHEQVIHSNFSFSSVWVTERCHRRFGSTFTVNSNIRHTKKSVSYSKNDSKCRLSVKRLTIFFYLEEDAWLFKHTFVYCIWSCELCLHRLRLSN